MNEWDWNKRVVSLKFKCGTLFWIEFGGRFAGTICQDFRWYVYICDEVPLFVILLTWKSCQCICLQPASPQVSGEEFCDDCSQTLLRLPALLCDNIAVCFNWVQSTSKNVFFAAKCWSHSTVTGGTATKLSTSQAMYFGPTIIGLIPHPRYSGKKQLSVPDMA